ncbi:MULTISPECIES: VOC family protein [Rhizobium]|uniref:VOC family protein n=1 Tax=Rhizobium TaxID=379 RepID=UPI0007EBDE43|nr:MULTISPECIES: VOC family protein [Rhizobium]ANK90786.1 ring-cleaving dioxygenase protein [Rhizobium sp. N6212]ANK96815.1 ring-cleaving dioxygenase protein [Rhizobium sp. N621]ANL02935.1 ring-cleaving dioxygenase protein [Rhizobium esperanzae]ANL08984.1 ring-cleaving dioxygenase protein [Rhizobium sp. N1341]ANL21031.1 ring-cleaving dioxygenase protein [Rhizobium sp. N113]
MTTETSYALTRPAYIDQSHLVVTDLGLVSGFYQSMLGLKVIEKTTSGEVLGVGGHPLLTLTTAKDAVVAPRNAAGLFHTAFLMPDRAELARWLRHAAHNNVVLDGASDHLVSEAIYLSDPESNGIEIYADRPHKGWKFLEDGMVEMATQRLDLQALYNSASEDRWDGMAEGTAIGHLHLQVGDIPQADAFYRDVLGLELMARYPGASFFATGGYHHHLAANIWNSRGATARADNMTGLSDYRIRFNDKATLDAAVSRFDALEINSEKRDGGVFLKDPWGIGLTLSA